MLHFKYRYFRGIFLVENARWELFGEQFLMENFLEGIFLVESLEFWSI